MKNKKAVTFSVKSILTCNEDHASGEIGDLVDENFGLGGKVWATKLMLFFNAVVHGPDITDGLYRGICRGSKAESRTRLGMMCLCYNLIVPSCNICGART